MRFGSKRILLIPTGTEKNILTTGVILTGKSVKQNFLAGIAPADWVYAHGFLTHD